MFKWIRRLWGRPPDPALEPPIARPSPAGFDLIFGPQGGASRPVAGGARTVALVGNCIAEGIAQGLASAPAACNRYHFVAVPLHMKQLDSPEVQRTLADASVVVVQGPAARDRGRIELLRDQTAPIIDVPDAVLRSPWPWDGGSGYVDDRVNAAIPNATKNLHDGALASLRKIEPDPERRFQRYRALDFDLADRIDRVAETQRRFLEDIDKANDVHLGRFIARHYRDRQLFYNSTHPTALIFQELCEYVWGKLEIPGEPPTFDGLDMWQGASVPVHPAVAHKLRLTWATEATRYACGSLGIVTWEEWARAYIRRFG